MQRTQKSVKAPYTVSAPAYDRIGLVASAKRRPMAGCLACAACLIILVTLAYHVAPLERLDARVLSELTAPPGSFIHDVAFLVEQLVLPLSQVVAVVLACLIALGMGRPRRAFIAVALVAGAAAIDLTLKALLSHPRHQFAHGQQIGSGAYPWANSFPSGNAAGALAISLAFLFVVPRSWRRPTAAIGIVFTLAVSVGLLVLNYHYPSDILGGWLVAVGWCLALLALHITDAPRPHSRDHVHVG